MARNYKTSGFSSNLSFGALIGSNIPEALVGIANPVAGFANIYRNLFGDNREKNMSVFDALYRDYTGETSQQREFEQQEYLIDKMNEFNSPENQLKRMSDAGINPHAAAAAIAGQPTESAQAPQVSSATTAPAAALGSASQAVGSINQLANNAAQRRDINASADLKQAQAESENQLRENRKQLLAANIQQALESAGESYWNAMTVSKRYLYIDDEMEAKLAEVAANTGVLREQRKLIKEERRNAVAKFDQIIAETELAYAQADEATKNAALAEVRARREAVLKEIDDKDLAFLEKYGIMRGDPLYAYTLQLLDDPDPDRLDRVFRMLLGTEKAKARGIYVADPFNEQYVEAFENAETYEGLLNDANQLMSDWTAAYKAGKVTKGDYDAKIKELKSTISELNDKHRAAVRATTKMGYSVGHATQLQNMRDALVNIAGNAAVHVMPTTSRITSTSTSTSTVRSSSSSYNENHNYNHSDR